MAVHYEIAGPVAVITLDRPEARNAVDRPTADALTDACARFEADDDARGRGAHGRGWHVLRRRRSEGDDRGGAPRANRVSVDGDGPMGPTRRLLAKPVIAAVEGHAVAGGLELALWCDLRVAAEDAVLGVFCRRWGVPLIDGGTVRLPRLIGQSRALDLVLTGRAVGADEALGMGLVNRVVPAGTARTAALALATELSALPQGCLRSDRASLYAQWDLPLDDALTIETRSGMDVLRSADAFEGAARFAGGSGRHGRP